MAFGICAASENCEKGARSVLRRDTREEGRLTIRRIARGFQPNVRDPRVVAPALGGSGSGD